MMNMTFKRKLPLPQDIMNMYPMSEKLQAQKRLMMRKFIIFFLAKAINSYLL